MILRNFIEKLPNKITNIKIIFKYTIIQIILFKIKQIKSKIKISSSNIQSYFFYLKFLIRWNLPISSCLVLHPFFFKFLINLHFEIVVHVAKWKNFSFVIFFHHLVWCFVVGAAKNACPIRNDERHTDASTIDSNCMSISRKECTFLYSPSTIHWSV